jgi:NAD(P)-dependent dehydrogenase (short-subunit alcohol dehydrogenase family)
MHPYLIIGASSGIGLELAHQLAEAGHSVIGTYNTHKPEISHSLIEYHQLNVLDHSASLEFLPDALSGFAYCPGSITLRPFERIKLEDFEADFQLQVMGAIRVLQLIMPRLKKSTDASIVLFSTLAVQTGLPFHSQVSTSKGALEGLSRALAAEYAPKIRVNCIAPSLTDTPLAASLLNTDQKREANAQRHPLKRIGTASDIAHLAAFLLSEKSSWITGQIFPVDGGMSALRV